MVTTIPPYTNTLYIQIFIRIDVLLENKTPILVIKCIHIDVIIFKLNRNIKNYFNLTKRNEFLNKM